MSTKVADRAAVEQRLRLSLLSAFQMEPLLVPEEKLFPGPLCSGHPKSGKALL